MAQSHMSVYANKADQTITIIYDQTLTQVLLGIEYKAAAREMIFEFSPGKMPFGVTMNDEIHAIMMKAATITLIQIDLKTGQPVTGLEVPLVII